MPTYNIIQCPSCGHFQATAGKILKCKFCNRSRTVISKKGHATIIIAASVATAQEAAIVVQQMNQKPVSLKEGYLF